jgi:predicted dehydrogenase
MAHFVECVEGGKQPQLTGEDGRAVLEVICAAYQSARSGQRLALPFQTDAAKPIDLWLE